MRMSLTALAFAIMLASPAAANQDGRVLPPCCVVASPSPTKLVMKCTDWVIRKNSLRSTAFEDEPTLAQIPGIGGRRDACVRHNEARYRAAS